MASGHSYSLAVASTAGFVTSGRYRILVGGNDWTCSGGADANHFSGCVPPTVCNGGTGGTCNFAMEPRFRGRDRGELGLLSSLHRLHGQGRPERLVAGVRGRAG